MSRLIPISPPAVRLLILLILQPPPTPPGQAKAMPLQREANAPITINPAAAINLTGLRHPPPPPTPHPTASRHPLINLLINLRPLLTKSPVELPPLINHHIDLLDLLPDLIGNPPPLTGHRHRVDLTVGPHHRLGPAAVLPGVHLLPGALRLHRHRAPIRKKGK
jgi:hypothetical protein